MNFPEKTKIERYSSGERFRWEAVDRVTKTVYREDENGLGSFTQLRDKDLSHVCIYERYLDGEMCVDLAIPETATAVFVRRRHIPLDPSQKRTSWTILGYRWPDGTGQYTFFSDDSNQYLTSENFNAV